MEKVEDERAVAISGKRFKWLEKQGMVEEYAVLPLHFDDLRNDVVIALKDGLVEMVYRAYLLGAVGAPYEDDMTIHELAGFALGRKIANASFGISDKKTVIEQVRTFTDWGESDGR